MRIAFVTLMAGSPWGGSELLWSEAALQMKAQGHEVSAYVNEWSLQVGSVRDLRRAGVIVYGRPNPFPKAWQEVFGSLRGADLVVVSQGYSHDMVYQEDGRGLAEALLSERIPYGMLLHSFPEFMWTRDEQRSRLRHLLSRARFAAFFSLRSIAACERMIAAKVDNAVRIWSCCHAGVESDAPWPEPAPARLLMLGRIELQCKAHDVVLHALAGDAWRDRDWSLDIVGDGPDVAHLNRLTEFYDLHARVRVCPFVDKPGSVWGRYHALVVASRHETGPLTAIEAVLHGRVLIGTNVGSVPEIIQHGRTGFIASDAEPGALNLALEAAWGRRHEWREIGTMGRSALRMIYPRDAVKAFCGLLLSSKSEGTPVYDPDDGDSCA